MENQMDKRMENKRGSNWNGYIGRMDKKMETTIVC